MLFVHLVFFFYRLGFFYLFFFFFSSRRRHTRFKCDLEFRRVLFRLINKSKVRKIKLEAIKHFVEKRGFGGLIWRVQCTEQSLAPADGCACGVYAVVPVVIHIAVALAAAGGSGVAGEQPEASKKVDKGGSESVAF